MSAYSDADRDHNQAIGWLTNAIERERPGFLAAEAATAARGGHHGIAAVLKEWGDENANFHDHMRSRYAARSGR